MVVQLNNRNNRHRQPPWFHVAQFHLAQFHLAQFMAQGIVAGLLLGLTACHGLEARSPNPQPTASQFVMPSLSDAPSPSIAPLAGASPTSKSPETQKLEARLKSEIALKSGIPIQSVTCPSVINIETAKLLECQAIAEGKPFIVAISPNAISPNAKSPSDKSANDKSAETGKTNSSAATSAASPAKGATAKNELQWNTKGLLVLPKLEQTIRQGIKQQFQIDVKTSCGGKVRIAKPGDTFECKVTDQRGQTKAVRVRVDDENGGVTWKL
jgi:Domain of unknown function (DUF4333)